MRWYELYTLETIVFIIIDIVIRVKQFQTMGPHLVLLCAFPWTRQNICRRKDYTFGKHKNSSLPEMMLGLCFSEWHISTKPIVQRLKSCSISSCEKLTINRNGEISSCTTFFFQTMLSSTYTMHTPLHSLLFLIEIIITSFFPPRILPAARMSNFFGKAHLIITPSSRASHPTLDSAHFQPLYFFF